MLRCLRPLCKCHPTHGATPQAFVCFEDAEEARRACQKDRETFGDKWGERYVRVYPTLESDVADMQQAVAQQNMPMQPVSSLVLARPGLSSCCFARLRSAQPAVSPASHPPGLKATVPHAWPQSSPGRPRAPHGQRRQDEEPAV